MNFEQHIAFLEKEIGGGLHHVYGDLLQMKVYFYTDDIVSRSKYLDMISNGQNAIGLITCFLDRARHEDGKLMFPETEDRLKVLGKPGEPGSKLFSHYAQVARLMIAHDNNLNHKAKTKLQEAEKN